MVKCYLREPFTAPAKVDNPAQRLDVNILPAQIARKSAHVITLSFMGDNKNRSNG